MTRGYQMDRRPDEDPFLLFALLLADYEWTHQELGECGAHYRDFLRIVSLMREKLVAAGLVDRT